MRYSVIIPVFNAEGTLRRCVDSLLSQGRTDAEIILINDGSSDNSQTICEEYAKHYGNIRCIRQRNSGVSAARNAGLDVAQGDYILFVDSDDYVTSDYLSTIDRIVTDGSADLVQFSNYVVNGSECIAIAQKQLSALSREKLLPYVVDAICRKSINCPWAKLYKREIIERYQIRFPLGASVGEDRAFNVVYSFYIQSYIVCDKPIYLLNTENINSLSRKRHDDLKAQLEVVNRFIIERLESSMLPDSEKEQYRRAVNFDNCVEIYHDAKLMILDRKKWIVRQRCLMQMCKRINKRRMKYPRTAYCLINSLAVTLNLTPVIDAAAWVLTRRINKRGLRTNRQIL